MLDLAKNIETLYLPKDCQLIIEGIYDETLKLESANKRQKEYLLSRKCLKECCQKLGYSFDYDLTGVNKKVLLPENLIHSLSHSKQVAVALVAPKIKYQNLGIDIEYLHRPLTEKFINRITTALERELLGKHIEKRLLVATLIFSAKESIYKAFSSKINNFSYQNIEIWEELGALKAIIINQQDSFPILSLDYGFYKQTHLVTCLMIPKY